MPDLVVFYFDFRNVYEQLDSALRKERVYSAVDPTNGNIFENFFFLENHQCVQTIKHNNLSTM